ncbi:MAG: GNAT family N-acetyltransferase, partial [Candidatus Omnitrophica bacterium]|nr:GNAT family N-acetyltransferase [Candidatus Omnitrophota bacterium]
LGGKVIGFTALGINAAKKSARIILIAIHKKYRGKGYGSFLMRASLKWGAPGNKSIYVKTQKDNLHSLALYRKMGFKEIKREEIFFKNFNPLRRNPRALDRG